MGSLSRSAKYITTDVVSASEKNGGVIECKKEAKNAIKSKTKLTSIKNVASDKEELPHTEKERKEHDNTKEIRHEVSSTTTSPHQHNNKPKELQINRTAVPCNYAKRTAKNMEKCETEKLQKKRLASHCQHNRRARKKREGDRKNDDDEKLKTKKTASNCHHINNTDRNRKNDEDEEFQKRRTDSHYQNIRKAGEKKANCRENDKIKETKTKLTASTCQHIKKAGKTEEKDEVDELQKSRTFFLPNCIRKTGETRENYEPEEALKKNIAPPYQQQKFIEKNTNYRKNKAAEELRIQGISLCDFRLIKPLGKGHYGKVLLAELKTSKELYAIKCISTAATLLRNDESNVMTEKRVLMLGKQHAFLTHLVCSFTTWKYIIFVMEYIQGKDLRFHLHLSGKFDEARACFYSAEIISALMFLHKHGFIHRDLKPENILLDAEGHCKLTDFGLCKGGIMNGVMTNECYGTLYYMAPEILMRQNYNHSVDWWSMGIVMYEMMVGWCPFYGNNLKTVLRNIMYKKPVLPFPQELSMEAVSIIKGFLTNNPADRLGCVMSAGGENTIKQHPFLRKINWDLLEKRKIKPSFMPLI